MTIRIKFEEMELDYELPTLTREISQEFISMFGSQGWPGAVPILQLQELLQSP